MMPKTDMNLLITKMAEKHIDSVSEIEKVCFSSPWSPEGLREELENNQAKFLVAEFDNQAVGYIGVQEICGEAYVTNLAVLPDFRKKGIGRALLAKAAEGAKSRGCAFITLEVRKSNIPAISLYSSMGFATAGKRKNFYSSPDEDGIIMTLFFGNEPDT